MKISDMNWSQVEAYLKTDDRAILPIGSTEQHAHLSLSVDSILSEKVALEAAEPLGVPVFPVVAYGMTPHFRAYPGTISLRMTTHAALIHDILDGLREHGFRRIVIVNGHGGNQPAATLAAEWVAEHPGMIVKFHNWWNAPQTLAQVKAIDPLASHASWMENFPCTRIAGVSQPTQQKPLVDIAWMHALDPQAARAYLGDGNFGGYYQRSDEEMGKIWEVAVKETRAIMEGPWA